MAIIANFNAVSTGLSVKFTDSSTGVPTSWFWDFGFEEDDEEVTSILQNPTIVFPETGVYTIRFAASDIDGHSYPFVRKIIVSEDPTLMLTIEDMVQYEVPSQIPIESIAFQNLIMKWQLFMQPFTKPTGVSDADVFNQAKWPPIANVLISKLVVYDLIMKAATAAMAAYGSTSDLFSGQFDPTVTSSVLVCDFETDAFPEVFPNTGTNFTVGTFIVNNLDRSDDMGGTYTTVTSFITALNALNLGLYTYRVDDDGFVHIQTFSNQNIPTELTLNWHTTAFDFSHTNTFEKTAERISLAPQAITVSGSLPDIMPGPIRKMETGPSKTEWFDSSTFWRAMFASDPNANKLSTGFSGGIMQNLGKEVCSLAARLGIRLPMCTKIMPINLPNFLNTKTMGSTPCLTYWPLNWGICPESIWAWETELIIRTLYLNGINYCSSLG